ncbi:MAG: hypothetical protein CMP20_10500 [Rickettsiales bacterium]|nr:hypothetical protein [Rickettsiales bacterium]
MRGRRLEPNKPKNEKNKTDHDQDKRCPQHAYPKTPAGTFCVFAHYRLSKRLRHVGLSANLF